MSLSFRHKADTGKELQENLRKSGTFYGTKGRLA